MDKIDLFMRHYISSYIHPDKSVLVTISDGLFEPYLFRKLMTQGHKVKGLTRNLKKANRIGLDKSEIVEAVITLPKTLEGKLENVHTVISTIGTTQKGKGLFDSVADYESQINLLQEAQRAGVEKFICLTDTDSFLGRNSKIKEAHEKFMALLKKSGLAYTVVQLNGVFPDSLDNSHLTHKSKVSHHGKRWQHANRIYPEDLANTCADAVKTNSNQIQIGEVNSSGFPKGLNGFISSLLRIFKTSSRNVSMNVTLKRPKKDAIKASYENQPICQFAKNKTNNMPTRP